MARARPARSRRPGARAASADTSPEAARSRTAPGIAVPDRLRLRQAARHRLGNRENARQGADAGEVEMAQRAAAALDRVADQPATVGPPVRPEIAVEIGEGDVLQVGLGDRRALL